jgi:hypothetical protein
MKRLLLQTERFPQYLRNIELKYKLSDWELARTKIPLQLPVQGYIQAQNNYSMTLIILIYGSVQIGAPLKTS